MDTMWTNGAAREIALCWLAHALRSVALRVRNVLGSSEALPLLSVAAGDREPTILPALLRAIQCTTDAVPIIQVYSLASLDALSISALNDTVRGARVAVVCVEIEHDSDSDRASDSWRQVERLRPISDNASTPAAWIVVGFSCSSAAGLSLRVAVHASACIDLVTLETAVQPLHELREQCGLLLALELVTKLTATSSESTPSSKCDPVVSASLLASPVASQLPFQLLSMLLRWSYSHPRVWSLVEKPFLRKLALIPQPRVRHEIQTLHTKQLRLWWEIHGNDPSTPVVSLSLPLTSSQVRLPQDLDTDSETIDSGEEDASLPPLQRLSQCALWEKQKQFYRDHGIGAWSTHLIPFGVSSSSYLAMQYARLAVDFLRQTVSTTSSPVSQPRTPNCFVWEAASGSCKFLHAFLLHFYSIITRDQLETRLGLVPCVVATDLSDQVLNSREDMSCFQQYITDGRLDFAAFDTDTFLHSDSKEERGVLRLRHSGVQWHVGQERGPVFIIGNYFFDSLRSDVFVVTQHEGGGKESSLEIRDARIDPTTDNIPDMLFSLATLPAHPRDVPVYGDPSINATLVATLDRLEAYWASTQSADTRAVSGCERRVVNSSLVLFPVEANTFLHAVLHPSPSELTPTFPVAVVTGDATFSFRDAIPSSFIDETTGDLEIPHLSPHPDCFCLPVDLEIFKLAVSTAYHKGSASIVSTPTSDTFNVFFAQSSHVPHTDQQYLRHRFYEVFNHFSPSDCDLLWGLMRVDDGAAQLSTASQLALLAQTAWDFDVFSAVQWGLLHQWKQQQEDAELTHGSELQVERDRQRLVDAGQRSWRTFYVMDESKRSVTAAWTQLQMARWFYELQALAEAKAILDSMDSDHLSLRVASTYLLGLITYRRHDMWTALAWFRKCQQLEPHRVRLKKWVARTLLRLQEATQANEKTL